MFFHLDEPLLAEGRLEGLVASQKAARLRLRIEADTMPRALWIHVPLAAGFDHA
jgi:hypothetical protein